MLMKLSLSYASRQIVSMIFDGVRKNLTVDTMRMIKEIRRKLGLRECQRLVEKETEERNEKYVEIKNLADLIPDPRERSLAMREAPLPLTWDDLMEMGIKDFTLDSAYITFIETELGEQLRDSEHHFAGIEVMAAAMKEAIACLADELKYAEPVREETS